MNFKFLFLTIIFGVSSVKAKDLTLPLNLCKTLEKIFFSCETKSHKIISLCGSKDLSKTQGYLQYRYGKKENLELAFPKDQGTSATSFFYAHYSRFKTEYTRLSFSNEGSSYSIFVNNIDEKKPSTTAGVTVTPKNKKEVSIYCSGEIESHLSDLEKIASCDPDDALTGGTCP